MLSHAEGKGPCCVGGESGVPIAVLRQVGSTHSALSEPGNLGPGVSGQNMHSAAWLLLGVSSRLPEEAGRRRTSSA